MRKIPPTLSQPKTMRNGSIIAIKWKKSHNGTKARRWRAEEAEVSLLWRPRGCRARLPESVPRRPRICRPRATGATPSSWEGSSCVCISCTRAHFTSHPEVSLNRSADIDTRRRGVCSRHRATEGLESTHTHSLQEVLKKLSAARAHQTTACWWWGWSILMKSGGRVLIVKNRGACVFVEH